MRWSKFKNNDPRDIFNVISQRVFPAIKNMKHGRLPDFTEQGELVEIADDSSSDVQNETAFARYMSDAMFLIPTPQVLQKNHQEQIGAWIKPYLSSSLKYDVYDFSYQTSEYEALKGKQFQMLFVEDTPQFLPFISRKEGSNIKPATIYIRRGTSDEQVYRRRIISYS